MKTDSRGGDMRIKGIIKSQYDATLAMLKQAIEECPDTLWRSREYKNQFWHIAYHVIFYTHFYLHQSEDDFVPWENHQDEYVSLEPPGGSSVKGGSCSKEEVLAYHNHCLEQVDELVDSLDLDSESGFYWLPFNKLEL
jgi:hypothetical protein